MLELRALACARGARVLFAPVSRMLPAGRMLRVRGANGAGKTTLLRTVCALAAPASGQVLWSGRRVSAQPVHGTCGQSAMRWGHRLVFIGHEAGLKDHLDAQENLRLACALAGQTPPSGTSTSTSTGNSTGTSTSAGHALGQRPVRQLSQGQRRRVALARLALSPAAALWVLDEPFNALDDEACAWLRGLIAGHLARQGTVLLTSHHDSALGTLAHEELVL